MGANTSGKLTKLTINKGALQAVAMNSALVRVAVDNYANKLLDEANAIGGATYGLHPAEKGKTRCHAIIYTPSKYAIYSNAKHKTLATVYANHKT